MMDRSISTSDSVILSKISGNIDVNGAILTLYQQFAGSVTAYIINKGGSSQDGEDIFQETIVSFIELVRENKFRGESGIKTFLIAIARNLWLNEWKKRGQTSRREMVYEKGRDEEEADLTQLIQERETQKQLLDILTRLGEPCKKLLILFYYHDVSMRELAEKLSYTNEQVVRNKKHKCMKELTDLLRLNPAIAVQIKEKIRGG